MPDARVSAPLTWSEVPHCDPADFTLFTMPKRFAEIGDPHSEMDAVSGSLDGLLELAARDAANGVTDAPWPGEFRRGRRTEPARPAARATAETPASVPSSVAAEKPARAQSRSRAKAALLVIAKSADRDAALAGLERWLHRHAKVAAHLSVADILVNSMRGRSTNWTRVRVNLKRVPEGIWPRGEKPDPDQEP